MKKTFIIADVGINHNGDIEIAKKLILAAKEAGCDAVKFQKRNIDKVYTPEELAKPRESKWGTTTREQKLGLEFREVEYDIINAYCKMLEIDWFASPWDLASIEFLKKYDLKYNKVASARLRHIDLLNAIASEKKYTFISTGMSSMDEIKKAVDIFKINNCPFELMHCNSQYPVEPKDLNLNTIRLLKNTFNCKVGYSGHEVGLSPSLAAVAIGATSIERHITLDRSMSGSDQAASIEPSGFKRLVEMIREIDVSMGKGEKIITEAELVCKKKLDKEKDVEI